MKFDVWYDLYIYILLDIQLPYARLVRNICSPSPVGQRLFTLLRVPEVHS